MEGDFHDLKKTMLRWALLVVSGGVSLCSWLSRVMICNMLVLVGKLVWYHFLCFMPHWPLDLMLWHTVGKSKYFPSMI